MAEDNKQDTRPDKDNVASKLVEEPIADLVGAPLDAVCDAQKKLAQSAFEFMQEVAFQDEGKASVVEFHLQRPVEGSSTPQDETLQVPILSIVPIPYIGVNDVQVDFEMNVTTNEPSTENKE